MATDSEMLTKLNEAIYKVTEQIADGNMVTDFSDGSIRIRKASPDELLKTLRAMRDQYAAAARTDRRPGVMTYGGAQ